MLVNVGPIRRQRGGSVPIEVRVDQPDQVVDEVEFPQGVPLTVEGTVTNTGKGYLVEGQLRAEVALECSRCLKPMRWPLEASLCERFYSEDEGGIPLQAADDSEEQEDDVDEVHRFHGDQIDLTEVVREQVLVSIPMKPVCAEDCKGICSTCGADLAQGPCNCNNESVDIRLAPLADWLKKEQERNGGS